MRTAGILTLLCILAALGSSAEGQRNPNLPEEPLGPTGVELQTQLMKFADRVVFSTKNAIEALADDLDTPEKRTVALERKYFMTAGVYRIATQMDPDAALLDMMVLVTRERIGTEKYWMPEFFEEQGQAYLESLRTLEESIWALGEQVMTPAQTEELRSLAAGWENKPSDFLPSTSFSRLSRGSQRRVRSAGAGEKRSKGLFASVRSAAEMADDISFLAERSLYYLQRKPVIVGAQVEYEIYKMGQAPHVTGALEGVSTAVESLEKLATLADQVGPMAERLDALLPDETTDLAELLETEDERIRGLLKEVRTTTDAGNELVASLKSAIEATDDLMNKMGLPLDHLDAIRSDDMQASLAQVTEIVTHLDELMANAERLLGSDALEKAGPRIDATIEQVEAVSGGLIDRAFYAGVKLIVIFLLGLLATLLAFRYLAKRIG